MTDSFELHRFVNAQAPLRGHVKKGRQAAVIPTNFLIAVRVTAATNKAESYHGFAQWLGFGNNGVLADNDPAEQEKLIKLNTLLANLVIFHNAARPIDLPRMRTGTPKIGVWIRQSLS